MNTFKKLLIFLVSVNVFTTMATEIHIFGNGRKPPKNYNENGKPKGILVDMMKSLEPELNYTFKIQLTPWKRAYHYASQELGGLIGFSKTEQRLKMFDYSDVMYYDSLIIVVLKGQEFEYENISDLQGKRVAVLRGGVFGTEYEKALKDSLFIAIETNHPRQRLLMLIKKRVDVVLIGPGRAGLNAAIGNEEYLIKKEISLLFYLNPLKETPIILASIKK